MEPTCQSPLAVDYSAALPNRQSLADILGQVSNQFGTDPSTLLLHLESLTNSVRATKSFEELCPAVRDKIVLVCDKCQPFVKIEHFDSGVRHWLVQIQALFGEEHAVAALSILEQAANLEGIRKMKAFITTRLIDHYEHLVWAQDPKTYARGKLHPDMFSMLCELINGGCGLKWSHFDPKVLDAMREVKSLDAIKARLHKLCVKELHGVINVPAYLYTLLSKRNAAMNATFPSLNMNNGVPIMTSKGLGSSMAPMMGLAGPLNVMPQALNNPMQQMQMLNQAAWAARPQAVDAGHIYGEQYIPISNMAGWNGGAMNTSQYQPIMGYQSVLPVSSMALLSNASSSMMPVFSQGLGYQTSAAPMFSLQYPTAVPTLHAVGAAV